MEQYIDKLRKRYNYFDNKAALKLLAKMDNEEKEIALNDPEVQKTIMNIDDTDTLRAIFRNVPPFFKK